MRREFRKESMRLTAVLTTSAMAEESQRQWESEGEGEEEEEEELWQRQRQESGRETLEAEKGLRRGEEEKMELGNVSL